jgi:hypothetical protein
MSTRFSVTLSVAREPYHRELVNIDKKAWPLIFVNERESISNNNFELIRSELFSGGCREPLVTLGTRKKPGWFARLFQRS